MKNRNLNQTRANNDVAFNSGVGGRLYAFLSSTHVFPCHLSSAFMSSAPARFLFIFLFVIHCLLWSQSRYTQLPQSSLQYGEKSLVRRISDELLNRNAVSTTENFGHQVCLQIQFDSETQGSIVLSATHSHNQCICSVLTFRRNVPPDEHFYL
jgi:hypothetical protein